MIKLKNVSLVFEGGSVALSNVSAKVSEGEFIRYIGVWLLMSTVNTGTSRRSF